MNDNELKNRVQSLALSVYNGNVYLDIAALHLSQDAGIEFKPVKQMLVNELGQLHLADTLSSRNGINMNSKQLFEQARFHGTNSAQPQTYNRSKDDLRGYYHAHLSAANKEANGNNLGGVYTYGKALGYSDGRISDDINNAVNANRGRNGIGQYLKYRVNKARLNVTNKLRHHASRPFVAAGKSIGQQANLPDFTESGAKRNGAMKNPSAVNVKWLHKYIYAQQLHTVTYDSLDALGRAIVGDYPMWFDVYEDDGVTVVQALGAAKADSQINNRNGASRTIKNNQNHWTVDGSQYQLLQSFAQDLQYNGFRQDRLEYWSERLDSAGIPLAVQNVTSNYVSSKAYKDVYLSTYLGKYNITVPYNNEKRNGAKRNGVMRNSVKRRGVNEQYNGYWITEQSDGRFAVGNHSKTDTKSCYGYRWSFEEAQNYIDEYVTPQIGKRNGVLISDVPPSGVWVVYTAKNHYGDKVLSLTTADAMSKHYSEILFEGNEYNAKSFFERELRQGSYVNSQLAKKQLVTTRRNGSSSLIPFVVEIDGQSYGEWKTKTHGRASTDNLGAFVERVMDSMNDPNGVNHHIVESSGVLFAPSKAKIINQRTGQIVAIWTAPKFMLLPDYKRNGATDASPEYWVLTDLVDRINSFAKNWDVNFSAAINYDAKQIEYDGVVLTNNDTGERVILRGFSIWGKAKQLMNAKVGKRNDVMRNGGYSYTVEWLDKNNNNKIVDYNDFYADNEHDAIAMARQELIEQYPHQKQDVLRRLKFQVRYPIENIPHHNDYRLNKNKRNGVMRNAARKNDVALPDCNLWLKGFGLDVNGNNTVRLTFPNTGSFSIQTGQGTLLGNTHRLTMRGMKVNQLTNEELETIADEVINYIQKYGSRNQQTQLRTY